MQKTSSCIAYAFTHIVIYIHTNPILDHQTTVGHNPFKRCETCCKNPSTILHVTSYKTESLAERTKPGQKRNAGPRHGYGQAEMTPSRDEDALWNFTRTTPIKAPLGDLETDFRAQAGNLTDAGDGQQSSYLTTV